MISVIELNIHHLTKESLQAIKAGMVPGVTSIKWFDQRLVLHFGTLAPNAPVDVYFMARYMDSSKANYAILGTDTATYGALEVYDRDEETADQSE